MEEEEQYFHKVIMMPLIDVGYYAEIPRKVKTGDEKPVNQPYRLTRPTPPPPYEKSVRSGMCVCI